MYQLLYYVVEVDYTVSQDKGRIKPCKKEFMAHSTPSLTIDMVERRLTSWNLVINQSYDPHYVK